MQAQHDLLVIQKLPDGGFDMPTFLRAVERAFVLQALECAGWNCAKAARLLRLNRTTLVEKMRRFEISQPRAMNP